LHRFAAKFYPTVEQTVKSERLARAWNCSLKESIDGERESPKIGAKSRKGLKVESVLATQMHKVR